MLRGSPGPDSWPPPFPNSMDTLADPPPTLPTTPVVPLPIAGPDNNTSNDSLSPGTQVSGVTLPTPGTRGSAAEVPSESIWALPDASTWPTVPGSFARQRPPHLPASTSAPLEQLTFYAEDAAVASEHFQVPAYVEPVSGGDPLAEKVFTDDGALINVLDYSLYMANAAALGALSPCAVQIMLADGSRVDVRGTVQLAVRLRYGKGSSRPGQIRTVSTFHVMDGRDGWDVLLGRPWLSQVNAWQNAKLGVVQIWADGRWRQFSSWAGAPKPDAGDRIPVWALVPEAAGETGSLDRDLDGGMGVTERPRADCADWPRPWERWQHVASLITIGGELTSEERETVLDLIRRRHDAWAVSMSDIEATDLGVHEFAVDDTVPLPKKPTNTRMSKPMWDAALREIDKLLEAGLIRPIDPGDCKCVSSIIMVPKRVQADATSTAPGNPIYRLVHDYRPLNKAIRSVNYVPGDLHAMMARHSGRRWLNVLDQMGAFYAFPVSEACQPYLAFYLEGRGFFTYLRMPQGLSNSPTTQQLGNAKAFKGLLNETVSVWMDDIVLSGDAFDDVLQRLDDLLGRVISHRLRLSPAKTKLFQSECVVGGNLVGRGGVRPDPDKVAAIQNWPTPDSAHDVLSFLNTVGYFRTLIDGFAAKAEPLQQLLRGLRPKDGKSLKMTLRTTDVKKRWDGNCAESFQALKNAVSSYPVVHEPRYGKDAEFHIDVDASAKGFGGRLYQVDEVGSEKTIAFTSRRTTPTEAEKHSYEQELLATKHCLDKFGPLVFGQRIIMHTDCAALKGLATGKGGTYFQRADWREALSHVAEFKHKAGKSNIVADGLSRSPDNSAPTLQPTPNWEDQHGVVNDLTVQPAAVALLRCFWIGPDLAGSALRADFDGDTLYGVVCYLTGAVDSDADSVVRRAKNYWVEDGKLYTRSLVDGHAMQVLPTKQGANLARKAHEDNGHMGAELTARSIRATMTWSTLSNDARRAVASCDVCQRYGSRLVTRLLKTVDRYGPFQLLALDYLHLPQERDTGEKYVLFAIDCFTRMCFAYPFGEHPSGATTVTALTDLERRYLRPDEILTDNGPEFVNGDVRTWCGSDVFHSTCAPYTHVGLAENGIHLVLERLRRLGHISQLDVGPATNALQQATGLGVRG